MYPETILPIAAHIPHAGTHIPSAVRDQFVCEPGELWREIATVTDWYTDELFRIPGIAASQTPISRVVVDLERYANDNMEEKAALGQGVIYAHNTRGKQIRRKLVKKERRYLLDNYYRPWHLHLELMVEQQLARWGQCLLLDCHSFPDEPFGHERDNDGPRPDICLGTNSQNTPLWLLQRCVELFGTRGYSVKVDAPYAGCLVPDRFLGNPMVPAIMLEVNRRLYLEPTGSNHHKPGIGPNKRDQFRQVQHDIWSVALMLAQEAVCRGGD